MRVVPIVLVALIALITPTRALGQSASARAEASEHFDRGLELYDEGRLVEALAEFEEAYRLAPTPALLFNLAQLHADLGHAVEAADAYERFLAEPGSSDASMMADARTAMAAQRARIGRVKVSVSVDGARLFLDDVEIGNAPLAEPVRVSAGEHVLMAQLPGYESQRHRFRVAGSATYTATLVLVPSGSRTATLRLESRVPGVEVRIDGASMGITPLASTVPVPAGSHHIEAIRDGYIPYTIDVTVADGAEVPVLVQTAPDPGAPASTRAPLRVRVPRDAAATLRIDGEIVELEPTMEVPVGLHDIDLRVADREPIEDRIDVLAGEGAELDPPYTWTADGRGRRRDAANDQRTAGLVPLLIAAPITVAAVVVLVWNLVENLGALNARAPVLARCTGALPPVSACTADFQGFGYPATEAEFDTFIARFESDYSTLQLNYNVILGISIAVTAIGGIASAIGLGMVLSAPSDEDIEREGRGDEATLELRVGPGFTGVVGTF